MNRYVIATLLTLAVALPLAARAETAPSAAEAKADAMTEGEIKKVDIEQKKLTIKHGEIKNLGMPPMTMVFKVKDPAMLNSVKAGDKVAFVVERLPDGFTVTTLQVKN